MPRVYLPDGRVVNFPDGMSEQDIARAMDEIAAPAPEEKTVGGFLGNLASSTGNLVSDTVRGIPTLLKVAGQAVVSQLNPEYRAMVTGQIAQHLPETAQAIGHAAKERYGGWDQVKNTLYNDPAGVVGDIATLADGVGLVAKAGGASKIARLASGVGEAVNPLRVVTAPAAKLAHEAGVTAVRGTLRPPAAVRADFGGSRGIAEGVLKDRVFSEASAGRKLDRSVAQADQMLADAQASGVRGVPRIKVARSVLGEPKDTAQLRTRLGVPDETPKLTETAREIFRNNPSDIPLTEAQQMKREAQKLAYEAGADNLTVKKAAETAKARALRSGIEDRVPAVGPINERSQRLVGAKEAFAAAEDRPQALTNMLSILGGTGGTAIGGPLGGLVSAGLVKAVNSPRVGALAGIGMDAVGRATNSAEVLKAALLARLMGGGEQ